jgi:penicillin-binding protein 1C
VRRWRRAIAGGGFALGLWAALAVWVARTELPPLVPETSVEVLARDGSLLRAYTVADGRWRLGVDAGRVDPTYLAMLLAYEDKRFYRHGGVDPLALLRAGGQALLRGRVTSGGSTLTMQVARLIEEGPTGTWAGKLRQIRLALALERALSKEEILALYLHHAPMGGNLEGLRAGTFAWLGREADRLTEAQAALMIALPQSPAARQPDRHPDRARAARDRVLGRAQAAGVISAETYEGALREAVPMARRSFPAHAPHLGDRLRAAEPDRRIHRTTLDRPLQIALEDLARGALRDLPAQATVALMVADPQSGAVLASVGSGDYLDPRRQGFVDMTQALRSPGSVLKPLVYGLAFSDGLAHPETLLNDRPARFAGYAPQNFDRMFRGPVSAREALQVSLNLPVVELTQALGPARLMAALRQAGVNAVVPGDAPGLAVSLGGLGVSLEGLVQLYAAMARGGEAVDLSATAPQMLARQRLMSAEAAWHLGDILADAPRPARLPDWRLAFKTGTSYGHRDALALGYDGAHVAGVWVGRTDGAPVPGMFGVDMAAPLLFEIFARLGAGPVPLPPAPPATLVLAHADLPAPLQRFGARVAQASDAPELAFPPEGAALRVISEGVLARVERGRAPFTWFANGAPVLTASHEREARLMLEGPGFVTLSVVDAEGRGARVQVELR